MGETGRYSFRNNKTFSDPIDLPGTPVALPQGELAMPAGID